MAAVSEHRLFDPNVHEPLTDAEWDAERARAAIRTIVDRTEQASTDADLWPQHALDEEPGDSPVVACLYHGAAGVIWALHDFEGRCCRAHARLGRRSR